MKGLSLTQLAEELERQKSAKRDFMANTTDVRVLPNEDSPTKLSLEVGRTNSETFPINQHAVRQVGSRLNIPATYVDRLAQSHPDLLAHNINTLFEREPETRMIRTLDGNVRAFLSDRFRPLDNFDFAEAVLPKLISLNAQVSSCDITESRMYIKAIIPGVEREVKKEGTFMGDGGHNQIHILKPGICLSNSEVGAGSMSVQPGIHEVHCSNLMIFSRNAMKKYHVGRKQTNDQESMWEIFTDATKKQSDLAFWMQVADLVSGALDGALFESMVAECEAKMNGTQIAKPSFAVKELPNLSETEQEGVLAHLIRGGDLSQFGMQAAITSFAQDTDNNYERQIELEQLGGNIIELPRTHWEQIAEAA
jgi:hypothetical protein